MQSGASFKRIVAALRFSQAHTSVKHPKHTLGLHRALLLSAQSSSKRALQSSASNRQRQWRLQLLTSILIGLSFMLGVRASFLVGSLVSHCSDWLLGLLSSDWWFDLPLITHYKHPPFLLQLTSVQFNIFSMFICVTPLDHENHL